ncbi:TPA: Lrp/AsnC family transcriptional regulator [Bacillus mycoides]|nr:Lrp/AsnC family transcriptional regulator [Bacillus mycoides]
MKQLTTIKYSTKELCAFKGITPAYFRKDPEKHLNELRKTNDVVIEKGPNSNSPTFYYLTPLNENEMPEVLLDSNNEVKVTKNSEEQIGKLLKAVLFDGVVPIHKELAKIIGTSVGTVKNRVKEMKELGILLPTPMVIVTECDENTGEINEYDRKACYWYYYDTLPNGDIRKITDTTEVHKFYGIFCKQQISYLKSKHGANYNPKLGGGLADNFAKKRLNEDFPFYSINRVAEWNINKEYLKNTVVN